MKQRWTMIRAGKWAAVAVCVLLTPMVVRSLGRLARARTPAEQQAAEMFAMFTGGSLKPAAAGDDAWIALFLAMCVVVLLLWRIEMRKQAAA